VGSKEYHPQEMATRAMFTVKPESVWAWYLYRRNVCNQAQPNPGHRALVEMEKILAERFLLITQNVDGLHLRAGNSLQRTYQIHGNVNYARCSHECTRQVWPLSDELNSPPEKKTTLTEQEAAMLHCPNCGGWARPHILWFDEYYDEEYYHYQSSIHAAANSTVLLVIGTSGATNLPMQVADQAARAKALIIDVNIESNPFSQVAEQQDGYFLQGPATVVLPEILNVYKSSRS
jgi:NAD-dependent protein deacetylase/lipoamidase